MAKYTAKKIRTTPIWYAIVLMIIGALLIVGGSSAAENISKWMVTVIGIVLIVFGVLSAASGLVSTGIVEILFGVLMVVFAWLFYWVAFLFLGICLFAYGIRNLALHSGFILTNIIDLIVGLAIILLSMGFRFQWNAILIEVIYIVAGAMMFIDGIMMLVGKK